jgi:surface antigen
MKFKILMSAALAMIVLSGCVTNPETQPKQSLGTLLGAGIGGLAGSQLGHGKGKLVGVAIGALAGAYIGSSIGESLDRADRVYMNQAQDSAHAAPVGRRISWNNPDNGHAGSVTPKRDGYDRISGDYCREYETTIFVDGREETVLGTACQKPDGSWVIKT